MTTEYWQGPGWKTRFRSQVSPSSVEISIVPFTRSFGMWSAWENSSTFASAEPWGASGWARTRWALLPGSTREGSRCRSSQVSPPSWL